MTTVERITFLIEQFEKNGRKTGVIRANPKTLLEVINELNPSIEYTKETMKDLMCKSSKNGDHITIMDYRFEIENEIFEGDFEIE